MWVIASLMIAPGEAFVRPSPTVNVLRGVGYASSTYPKIVPMAKQRGHVHLNGPLNVMSMEQSATVNVTDSWDSLEWAKSNENPPQELETKEFFEGLAAFEEEVKHIESSGTELTTTMRSDSDNIRLAQSTPTEKSQDYPSIKKIVKFSLPAIGVWLCSPVLSMIDTASVGLLSGTVQQAALNPAVSVTDYGALLVAFMYTATTNLIAASREKDAQTEGNPRTTKTLITALRLALVVGVIFGAVLGTSANFLLKMLIGNDSLDPNVFGAALRYVQIRSLGMPAAVVIGTAQSACLGMQDVRSPLYVLAAAAAINFCGDVLLVRNGNPWLGGAAGAAWATVFSQYGALLMFLKWLTHKRNEPKKENAGPVEINYNNDNTNVVKVTRGGKAPIIKPIRKKLFSSRRLNKRKNDKISRSSALARGFLAGKHKDFDVLNVAALDKPTAKRFLPFVIPVTTTSIGRVSGYVAMSHVASSALGTLDMAAHQIAISIFCCLAPIVDALNQVAQSFVPGIFERKRSKERALALRKTSINFAKVGAAFGAVIVGLVSCTPWISRFFTSDPLVLERVKNAIPGIAVFLGFDGLMCISEGTLLGQKDLAFLRNMYASFFFIVPAFMFRLKRRALSGIPVGIGTMWGTFSAYEVVRTILWLLRVVQLQLRTEKEAKDMEANELGA